VIPEPLPRRRARLAAALLLVPAALVPSACTEVETESAAGYEPSALHPVKGGGDRVRVTFTAEAAKRIGLRTARIRARGDGTVAPYASLIYDAEGKAYVYASPKPLSYERVQVDPVRVTGDSVLLSNGPPAGSAVVTTGATEVYGTELEVPSH
jgi:hypothetical protein